MKFGSDLSDCFVLYISTNNQQLTFCAKMDIIIWCKECHIDDSDQSVHGKSMESI